MKAAELIAQRQGKYDDDILNTFIRLHPQYQTRGTDDLAFIAGLERAAD